MLHLHFSNRFEMLRSHLLDRLADGPPRGVFEVDTVIVPSVAVRRALTLALADRHGICAQVRFEFLAQWLWQQIGRVVPGVADESPYAAPVLTWRIHAALGDATFVAHHPRLRAYLQQADDAMRHELAQRIAGLFDQTLTYRPDWLECWLDGRPARLDAGHGTPARAHRAAPAEARDALSASRDDEAWQAALWRRIHDELGRQARPPAAAFVETLRRSSASPGAAPAPAVHVFALPTMPPLHLQLLQQVAGGCDVHVYALNPCRHYWMEVVDSRRLARLAARGQDQAHETGNRLLAAWGRQTQSHLGQLIDIAGGDVLDDGLFVPNPRDSLLARLQNAMLELVELEPGSCADVAGDRSIELHVCHSMTRQLEVLHDHLLGLFSRHDDLRPGQVLVVMPDLEAAAPLIDAVFGTVPPPRRLPFAVTGRARSRVNGPAQVLLALLSLVASRFPASAVFGLLQQGLVARRFGLDDEALQRVHGWMQDAGMHWGLDGAHRAGFDVPADGRHSLADGLERLVLGYALPSQAPHPFDGRLPCGDAEGSDALVLGALCRFVDALRGLHERLSAPLAPAAWGQQLAHALDTFVLPAGDEMDELRQLRDDIRDLTDTMARGGLDAPGAEPLPLAVVRAALAQWVDDPARGGVPGGGITFTSMSSLRSLPNEVVCILGLDDGAFPTASRPAEFDLIARHPRPGDRQRRHDERNLLLDVVLAARRGLFLGHTGRSVRDNAPLPPSVLVADLLDVLEQATAADPADAASRAQARAALVVSHPLQAFAAEAFRTDGDPRLRSHDDELADALRAAAAAATGWLPPTPAAVAYGDIDDTDDSGPEDAAGPQAEAEALAADRELPRFFNAALAAPDAAWRDVTLGQLVEFYRNPCRYLLRRRLALDIARDPDELQDDEPFLAGWPQRDALARRLMPALLDGADDDTAWHLARAGTEMPGGAVGELQTRQAVRGLARLAARVRAATALPCLPPHTARARFQIDGETWTLQGGFADLRSDGLVRWAHDDLRVHHRLEAWLTHLLLCADRPAGMEGVTRWLALDDECRLRTPDDAHSVLAPLMAMYRRGLRQPLPFFPKSSFAYTQGGGSLAKARKAWLPGPRTPHAEAADPACRLAQRGRDDPLDDDFMQCADAVFGPLLAHADDGGAAGGPDRRSADGDDTA